MASKVTEVKLEGEIYKLEFKHGPLTGESYHFYIRSSDKSLFFDLSMDPDVFATWAHKNNFFVNNFRDFNGAPISMTIALTIHSRE